MNNSQGALYFGAGINMQEWRNNITEMRRDILGLTNTTQTQTRQMDSSFRMIGTGLATYFSGAALGSFANQIINVRGEFQKTEIAFGTMLKSTDKAKALMGQMVELAAKTPFSLQDVSSGAKQLLAFQVPAEEVVDTLTRMGNIAAGLGVPLSRINLVYGQVKAKGKLAGDDLRQFTEAGIPMLAELAKKFGTSTAAISEMVTAGKIGFKDVQDVLFGLTNEGGMFFNLMELQSKSLSGQMANLGDAFDQMLNSIGQSNESLLGGSIDAVTYLVEHYKDVLAIIEQLVVTYGAYRAAIIVNTVVTNLAAASEAGFTSAMMARLTVTRLVDTATKALNTTMLTNPIVLAITAIAGLTYLMYKLHDSTTAVERINRKVADSMNAIKTAQSDLKTKTEDHISVIRAEYSTQLQKYEAYQKLQTLYPGYLKNISMENFLKMETVEINKLLAKAQEQLGGKLLDQQVSDAERRIKTLKANAKSLLDAASKGGKVGYGLADNQKNLDSEIGKLNKLKFIQLERNQAEKVAKMSAQDRLAYYDKEVKSLEGQVYQHKQKNKNLKDSDVLTVRLGSSLAKLSLSSINAQIQRMNAGLAEAKASVEQINKPIGNRTKGDWSAIKDKLEGDLAGLTKSDADGKKGAGIKAQIKEAEKALKSWEVTKEKSSAKDKVYTKGSVGWIDAQISKLQELQKNTKAGSAAFNKYASQIKYFEKQRGDKNGDNSAIKGSLGALEKELSDVRDKLNNKTLISDEKTKAILLSRETELSKKIADIKKSYQTLSFDEEIAEIERQWRVRYALAEKYGKDVAKAQFPQLNGDSFYADVKGRFSKLDDKMKSGLTLTDSELAQWEKLKSILDNLNGTKDPFTNYKENLESSLSEISSSFERIKLLEKDLYTMSDADIDNGKKAYLIEKIEAEKKIIQDGYKAILNEQRTYEEKSLILAQEYAAMKNSEQYKKATPEEQKKVDKSFTDKQGVLDIDMIQKTAEWQVAFGELEGMTNTSLQLILQRLLDFQAKSKGTLTIQDAAELQKAIDNVRNAANNNPFASLTSTFANYRTSLKESKAAQEEYNRVLKETPNDAKKVADAGAKMIESDKKATDAKKKLLAQLQKGQDVFNAVGQGVMELGAAFGGMDDATKDAIGDIMAIGNAAFDLGKSIATGDVAGMIQSGIKLIGSIAGAINGDKKKEREIKRQAAALKELESVYTNLGRAIDKALGEKVFDASKAAIANLKQQKAILEQMIQTEKSKKEADQDKINGYKDQINSINNAIEDMYQSMIDKVLNGLNAKGLADQLADALTAAFQNGEDAATAMGKTVDKILADMVKNALKMKLLEPAMQAVIDKMMQSMGFSQVNNSAGIKAIQDQINALQAQSDAATGLTGLAERIRLKKQIDALKAQMNALINGQSVTGSFDGLTEAERDELKAMIAAATQNYTNALQGYEDLFGSVAEDAAGLKGSIKGITEQTADVLAGQMNAIRINQGELLKIQRANIDIMRSQLLQLSQIEQNTRPTKDVYTEIYDLNRRLKAKGF